MSNISDLKTGSRSKLIYNIRLLKFISIILGVLIILGLFLLFVGMAKKYKNLENKNQNKNVHTKIEQNTSFQYDFYQPSEAQLISTSIGNNNQILLRYLYKGKNVIVVLNTKTKEIESVITLMRGKGFGDKTE